MAIPIVLPSPDKKHKAALVLLGKTQADVSCYSLTIDNLFFESRVFGKVGLWSPESRFLAVQEWRELDSLFMPKSYALLIVDVLTKRECLIASLESVQGNILPQGYMGESLIYTVVYGGQFGATKNFESKFHSLSGWQTVK